MVAWEKKEYEEKHIVEKAKTPTSFLQYLQDQLEVASFIMHHGK